MALRSDSIAEFECGHPIPWADEWWGVASCYRKQGHSGRHSNYSRWGRFLWTCEGMWCKHLTLV